MPARFAIGRVVAFIALAVGTLLAAPAFAPADSISFASITTSSGTYGRHATFTGSLSVDPLAAPNMARITVELTNTTPVAGWYLVGFGFNNPSLASGGTITNVAYTGDASYPKLLGIGYNTSNGNAKTNAVGTGHFGKLDFGFGLGRQWHTSGNAADGIPVGASGTFIYDVVVNGTISARGIFDTLSTSPGSGGAASIAVRFRRTDNLHTAGDKVAAAEVIEPDEPNPVPAPAGLLLGGVAGIVGLGLRKRLN